MATLAIAIAAPPLTKLAQQFAPADYFSLMALGLVFAVVLARGSALKAFGMIFLGMLLGLVGTDVNTGNTRFTFDISDLFDGLGFVPLVMGIFGIAEIMHNLADPQRRDLATAKISGLFPTIADIKRSIAPILRGTALGGLLGILPGGGAVLASFSAYTVEKKLSATPEKFGTGMIEGVAAPESANNAAAQTSFIPMLTLGIPSNAVMAMMIGGMMIHGIIPGPQVMEQRPGLFWGMIVSMWLGNLMLVVLNLPLIGIWVRMLLVPYRLLAIAILFFCCIGVYSLNNFGQRGPDHRLLRGGRLSAHEARLRAGAAAVGLPTRADDGGLHAPRHAAVARRSLGVPAAAAVAHVPDRLPSCSWCSSCCPTSARRGKQRSRSDLTAAVPARIL